MDRPAVVEVVRYLGRRLLDQGMKDLRCIVFGSQARGDADEESDIDVILVSPDFRGKDLFQRVDMFRKAETEAIHRFWVPIDVLAMTPKEFEDPDSLLGAYGRQGMEVVLAGQGEDAPKREA